MKGVPKGVYSLLLRLFINFKNVASSMSAPLPIFTMSNGSNPD